MLHRNVIIVATVVSAMSAYSADLTVNSFTILAPGSYTYDNVTVNDTLLCQGDSVAGTGVTINCNNFTINLGGTVTAESQGYGVDTGPGKSRQGSAGAGYGGYGGDASGVTGGRPYGSITNPTDLGSGGGSFGGGAIILVVANELKVNGTLSANGPGSWLRGNSGGSVNVRTKILSGSGQITANGGTGGHVSGADGGGGRIAVYYETNNFTGSILARRGHEGGWYTLGGCGTIFMKSSSQSNGDLILDGGGYASGYYTPITGNLTFDTIAVRNLGHSEVPADSYVTLTQFSSPSNLNFLRLTGTTNLPNSFYYSSLTVQSNGGMNIPNKNLTVGDNGVLEVMNTNLTLNYLTIKSTGKVTHTANYDSQARYKLNLTVNNDLTVEPGGSIDVSARGYPAKTGPGITATTDTNCGGSYGGLGTSRDGYPARPVYGSETMPIDLGSGGWTSPGGGAIQLNVMGTLRNDGSIYSDGVCYSQWGAGSGGSVYIRSAIFTGSASGRISARGNVGQWNDHGGGGRIAVWYYTNSSLGSYDTAGGWGETGPGTKYTTQTNFHLVPQTALIDNPAYSSPITGRRPSFKWTSPIDIENDSVQFEIEITQDSSFASTPAVSVSTVVSSSGFQYSGDNGTTWQNFPSGGITPNATPSPRVMFTAQQDLSPGDWYWRVRAVDVDGNGSWSELGYLPSIIGDVIIKINSPDDSVATYADNMKVEGIAENIVSCSITINGVAMSLDVVNGAFSASVDLIIGANTISVSATGLLANTITDTVIVTRLKIPEKSSSAVIGKNGGVLRLEDYDGDEANDAKLEIAEGVFQRDVTVKMERIDEDFPVYEITVNNMPSYSAKKKIKLTLNYSTMTTKNSSDDLLRIFYWDGVKWQLVGGEINKEKKTVSCWTNHFSKYAVMAAPDLREVMVSVSPPVITPNNDGINDIVTFNVVSKTSGRVEVRIFGIEGKIVRVIADDVSLSGISIGWDGHDENGKQVETGIYVFSVTVSGKIYGSGTIAIAR